VTALQLAAAAWWAVALAVLFGSTVAALLQPRRRRCPAPPDGPPVSVLVPLKSAGPGLEAATRSAFAQGSSVREVLFSAQEERSAAIDHVVEVAVAAGRAGTWRLVRTARALPGANPKVANLVEPIAVAGNDVLLIKDAETILPPRHACEMAASLSPRVGLVVSAPIGVGPASFAGVVECAAINTYGARLLLAASALGIGVGIGAAMMVRRTDLYRADALRKMSASIADDHALAKALRRMGLGTAMTAATVAQIVGRRRGADVWRRHHRWSLCRRREEPLAFALEPLAGAACAALMAAVAAPALGFHPFLAALATLLAWPVVECGLAAAKGWPLSFSTVPAILLRETFLPALWLAALASGRGRWREDAAASPCAPRFGVDEEKRL
jgi:ceramide glucosyltransferase